MSSSRFLGTATTRGVLEAEPFQFLKVVVLAIPSYLRIWGSVVPPALEGTRGEDTAGVDVPEVAHKEPAEPGEGRRPLGGGRAFGPEGRQLPQEIQHVDFDDPGRHYLRARLVLRLDVPPQDAREQGRGVGPEVRPRVVLDHLEAAQRERV